MILATRLACVEVVEDEKATAPVSWRVRARPSVPMRPGSSE
jgi:hypothetical protein